MQQAKLKNNRKHRVGKRVGMYNRFEPGCREYIRRMAKKKGVSQTQFIQNSIAVAGPDMPFGFKFLWNNELRPSNGKTYAV